MQKKTWVFLSLIVVALSATLLLSGRSKSLPTEPQKNSTACCKTKIQECLKKEKANAPGEMIMESLSRQFLQISPF